MSDPDPIRMMRDNPKPLRQTGLVDITLSVVALLAIAALGYFGVSWWSGQNPAPSGMLEPSIVTASLAPSEPWSESDTARCQREGRAASAGPTPISGAQPNPAVTDGFSFMATVLACRITTKSTRFCDPGEKSALVAMVNDYLVRIDLVVAGLNLQGAPMAMMGEMLGGEVAAGSAIYDIVKEDTVAVMRHYHKDVADGLRSLALRGVITAGDFAAFMGYGVPKSIQEIIGGVEPTSRICG